MAKKNQPIDAGEPDKLESSDAPESQEHTEPETSKHTEPEPSEIRHAKYTRDNEDHEDGGLFDVVVDADAAKPYIAKSSHRFWQGTKTEFYRDFEFI